jgi:hypothetical protein
MLNIVNTFLIRKIFSARFAGLLLAGVINGEGSNRADYPAEITPLLALGLTCGLSPLPSPS